jgi:chromosome segregation ATPase
MNAKLQFAEDVERLLQMIAGGQFAGIVEYAKQVGSVGSLEQAASEAETRLAKARLDLAAEDGVWKDTQAQWLAACDKMKKSADSYAQQVKVDADKILWEAKDAAAKTNAQAQEDAAKVLSAEKAKAESLSNQINKAQADLIDVQETLKSNQALLSDLNTKVMAKQAELDSVVAKHAAFLKSIGV